MENTQAREIVLICVLSNFELVRGIAESFDPGDEDISKGRPMSEYW